MKKLWLSLVLCTTSFTTPVLGHATQHAFLLQNSGWMEPFYQDPKSQLKPLVNTVIQTVTTADDQIVFSTFNQSNALQQSPQILFQGKGQSNLKTLLGEQQVAYKSDSAYADTDFSEAVAATITGPFSRQSGIIWVFTNNKNSPNNDIETVERNKEFYQLVHDFSGINKVLAFPLKMPVEGEHFNASGLMVYAFAFGAAAEQDLNRLIESGQVGKVFTQQPALLKPLDKEPIRLIARGIDNSTTIQASSAADGKTLYFDLEPKNAIPKIRLNADLKNNFYPYNIAASNIQAKLVLADGKQAAVKISQSAVNLRIKENTPLSFDVPIPSEVVVSPWSFAVFKAMGKRVVIPAQINVTFYNQKLTLSEQFKDNLHTLFPDDPLSDVFVAPSKIQSSTATIPVQFRLQYPIWPIIVMGIAGCLGLILLFWLLMLLSKAKRYEVIVNGVKKQTVQLKAFSSINIYSDNSTVLAVVKKGLADPKVQVMDKHSSVTLRKIK